ncbi:MAG: hypothetical protein ACT4P7_08145, partial [Gemmatimonadaceae bacterium]
MPTMSLLRRYSALPIIAGALTVGCGGEKSANDAAGEAAAAAAGADGQILPASMVKPIVLSENDVEHFIAAGNELAALGHRADGIMGDDPGAATQIAEGLRLNAEALAILRKHEFDLPRFQRVSYSVMMALAAPDVEKSSAGAQDAMANLEAMKDKIPTEQYEAMKKMTASASVTMKA